MRPRVPLSQSQRQQRQRVLAYLFIAVVMVVFIAPSVWMVLGSIQPNREITKDTPNFIPRNVTLANYERIATEPQFRTYFQNSLITTSATVLLSLVISIHAGYAFSRYRFVGKRLLMTGILSVQMFPKVAILITLFAFFARLELINTYEGLVLSHLSLTLPFSVWFMKAFIDSIPFELEEAALIDGAGRLRSIWQVVVPLCLPGIVSVAVYTFMLSWNDFVFALTLMSQDDMRTLPVGVNLSYIGQFQNDWSGMMALSTVASLPVVIMFILLQRFMIAGLTAGALKA
ncbi:MAG: carbohydrate ABC transporter permease [Anaerolineae bacterium]|nr:carbohydrate ABC transporter permease [Anaerolineae bacterium]